MSRGICIGCGACAAVSDGQIAMQLSPTGIYRPELSFVSENYVRRASAVCPFSDESPNEDQLAASLQSVRLKADAHLGRHTRTVAGRVLDDGYLQGSSSGGLASWMLSELLVRDLVDNVVSVGRLESSLELFSYQIQDAEAVLRNRKSHYYATSLSVMLERIRQVPGRYAVVGVPCYIRALRSVCRVDPIVAERVIFCIGLVCGHMKTQAYAESLAWQMGILPVDLGSVDFRVKAKSGTADDYSFGAKVRGDSRLQTRRSSDLVGTNWGHNLFQPEACNFCDDVVGETSDISLGDAWLPEFAEDPRGTSLVISRNDILDQVLDEGTSSGRIVLYDLTAEQAVQSQAGGFRHRREGLALRLADDASRGLSVPAKRVSPSLSSVSAKRASLLRHRRFMAASSHELFARAKEEGDLGVFLKPIRRLIRDYERLSLPPMQRLRRRVIALVPLGVRVFVRKFR